MCHLIKRQRFEMDLEHVQNRTFLRVFLLNVTFLPLTHLDEHPHSLYLVFSWKLNKLSKDVEELDLRELLHWCQS